MDNREPTTDDGGIDRENRANRTTGDSSVGTEAGTRGPLGRRTYLQAIGAYAAGRTLLGLSGRAAATEYETYEIDTGETFRRRVGDGETLENVLVDVTAPGSGFDIVADGSDWTIRNVGIHGTNGTEECGSAFQLQVDEGSEGTFENVYLGDGAVDGGNAGIFVPTTHAGTLTIRRCHVANWPDNGIYASAPGRNARDGRKGVVRIEECYARNNNIAGFRLGTDGSSVTDSVVHVDGDVPNNNAGKENARGIWIKEGGSVRVENCDVFLDHPDADACVIESEKGSTGRARVVDSSVVARVGVRRFSGNVSVRNVDNDPDVSLPADVPEHAKAAARGTSGNGNEATGGSNGSSGAKTIEFVGGDSDDGAFVDYTFETNGRLDGKKSIERGEGAPGRRATGATGGSGDGFVTWGRIESLDATLSGPEGQRRARVAIERTEGKSRVRFEGGNDQELLRYAIDATGPISATASVEERSQVSGTRARGATGGGTDELVVDGEIVSLRAALPSDGERFLVKVKPGR